MKIKDRGNSPPLLFQMLAGGDFFFSFLWKGGGEGRKEGDD